MTRHELTEESVRAAGEVTILDGKVHRAETGRWLGRDRHVLGSIDLAIDEPKLADLYGFDNNNPARFVDPNGQEPLFCCTRGQDRRLEFLATRPADERSLMLKLVAGAAVAGILLPLATEAVVAGGITGAATAGRGLSFVGRASLRYAKAGLRVLRANPVAPGDLVATGGTGAAAGMEATGGAAAAAAGTRVVGDATSFRHQGSLGAAELPTVRELLQGEGLGTLQRVPLPKGAGISMDEMLGMTIPELQQVLATSKGPLKVAIRRVLKMSEQSKRLLEKVDK